MNRTKLAALFVLAVFVVSIVPFVAAHDNDENGTVSADAEASAEVHAGVKNAGREAFDAARDALRETANVKREELKAKREDARDRMKEERKDLKEFFKETEESLKENKERLKEIREQFKEKREELKDEREKARAELGQVRAELRKCVGNTGEPCKDVRVKARMQAQGFLQLAAEHVLSVLAQARDRIEVSTKLSAEAKASALAGIDEAIAQVGATKSTIAALNESSTKQDIKDATQLLRQAWAKAKSAIKQGVGEVASERIGGILEKMEHLKTKFNRVIAHLKVAGKDTSSAEAKLADFNAKLDAAAKLQAEAKALFESGNHPAAAEKIRAAHEQLKAAQDILKGVMHEIRGIGGDKELEAESEESEEEEQTSSTSAEANVSASASVNASVTP